ncbi:hypothetical protein C8Q80DRAFT_1094050 [Daedaleopsis nitida]|nr:hypothetical protein C8Q80DRAFT_1094050 [Daedaleopsis nitida]
MFTPPSSPDPRRPLPSASTSSQIPSAFTLKLDVQDDPFLTPTPSSRPPSAQPTLEHEHESPLSPKDDLYTYALSQKKRVGRRIRWTVVLVPLILVFIALSTRYITHPAAFDVLASRASGWSTVKDWTPHKRHAEPAAPATTVDSKPTGSSLSVNPSATATPTSVTGGSTKVPSSPPALPTPFPQAFDLTFSQNFSTVGCQNFMVNMTNTPAFRECRPLSLLIQDSNAFITQSQRNVSELNVIVWGTCNTDLSVEQCSSNMAWFANNIQTVCKQDIAANNALVSDAVAGLQSYNLMREVGCQVDTDTDMYCYVEAAQSTHPSDLYLYQLPLGLALPNTTVPSCTACVQNVMGAFARDPAAAPKLQDTYASAAAIVNNACGSGFVATVNFAANGAPPARCPSVAGGRPSPHCCSVLGSYCCDGRCGSTDGDVPALTLTLDPYP